MLDKRNEVFSAENRPTGLTYRASIVWRRKWIAVEEESLIPGRTQIERRLVFAEAMIWTGGWFNLTFRPTLVLAYDPTEPADPRPAVFAALVREIIEECDLAKVAGGGAEAQLGERCRPARIWPMFGQRRHLFTRRRVPHVLLFGWPEGRPFPA